MYTHKHVERDRQTETDKVRKYTERARERERERERERKYILDCSHLKLEHMLLFQAGSEILNLLLLLLQPRFILCCGRFSLVSRPS
jgi:hypothetical protein